VYKSIDICDEEIRILEYPEKKNIEDDPAGEQSSGSPCHACFTIPQDTPAYSIVDQDGNEQDREIMQPAVDIEDQGNRNEQVPG